MEECYQAEWMKSSEAGGLKNLPWGENELGSHRAGLAGDEIRKVAKECLEP